MLYSKLLCLAVALRAHAAVVSEPTPVTVTADKIIENDSPATTQGPTEVELRKRQFPQIEFLAPDNTCGFVDGSSLDYISCPITATCAGILGDVMLRCCVNGLCPPQPSECYGYRAWLSTTFAATTALWCSNSLFPSCNGYTIPGLSKSVLVCSDTSQAQVIWDNIETTTAGGFVTDLWETLTDTASVNVVSTSSTPTSRSSASSVASASATASSSEVPTLIPPPPKEKPIGAIVGGAVGGVAVLALLVGGILLFLYKKKKRAQQDANPDYNNNYAPPQPPMSPAPGYYANTNQYYGGGKAYDAKVAEPLTTPVSPPMASAPIAHTPLPHQVPVVVPAPNSYRPAQQRGGNQVFEAA